MTSIQTTNKALDLKSMLENVSVKSKFEEMLGKKAPGFMSSILNLVNTNEKLKQCSPMSIISTAAIAATLDLPINQNLGYAYIIPYENKFKGIILPQFQMGYKGFIQLAMRTARYFTLNVSEVHEGELIDHNRFTGEVKFDHKSKKSDKIIGYVAYEKMTNGFEKYLYMTVEQLHAHGKKYSKSYKTGKWQDDFDSMAKKTVIKQLLSKWGMLSIDMGSIELAIRADQAMIKTGETLDDFEFEYEDNGVPDQTIIEPTIEQTETEKQFKLQQESAK